MSSPQNPASASNASRRDFLKTSGAAIVGGSLAASLGSARNAHAAMNDDTIKIALIGCGGRGTGAAVQALSTDGNTKLVAVADAFENRLEDSLRQLKKNERISHKIDVPKDRRFVGFDAYLQAINSGCDLVILTTPPGFRPMHYEAAVAAGKHVFMEKPVAVDASGVRQVLAATEEAKKKNLGVGVGLQRRHQPGYIETIQRLQDGAIGDITSARVYWNGSGVWVEPRAKWLEKNPNLTEMEYQMRNWYYFVWLCGDHIVEQHIHNMDVINWLKNAYPVAAHGIGGCETRKGPDYGEIFDHHCVEFEYADGSRMYSQCRHIPNCWSDVAEYVQGTKGTSDIAKYTIRPTEGERWRYRGPNPNPYQVEHDDLFASIRAGTPINEGEYGAKSTMTSILGRMCTYSGQHISWDDALKSELSVMPTQFAWDATPPTLPGPDGIYAHPVPGVTKVV